MNCNARAIQDLGRVNSKVQEKNERKMALGP